LRSSEDHIDELLAKYVANEATADEKSIVEAWVTEDSANAKQLDQLNRIFNQAPALRESQHFDTDAAWQKVKSKLARPEGVVVDMKSNGRSLQLGWRIAASIVVALGIGFYFVRQGTKPIDTYAQQATTTTLKDTLPDGSVAVLNKKSSLAYEYNRLQKKRKLKLVGEAYFNVKHEETKPFIIEAQEVIIEDIGTTFNVMAYPESNTIEVFVESGEVRFYTTSNKGLNLKEGETGIYNKVTKTFARLVETDTNVLAYQNHVFHFNNTDLGTILDEVNEVYNAKLVVVKEQLRGCRITVDFKGESLESIVDIIAETLNLTITKLDDQIMLDGNVCQY
jgi:ferric-dicitrate binding protein FerR (iron transport regulator)